MGVWDSRLAKVFIQPDGPGNPYYFTDPETDLDALGGGSQSFASDWGAQGGYFGSRKTSNPGDVTGTITSRRYDAASKLREIAESGCLCGLLAVNGCNTLESYDFNSALYLLDTGFTSRQNTGGRLVDSTPGENAKVVDTLPYRAAKAVEWRRLSSGRIATTVVATLLDIIAVGNKACAGCSVSNDGNKEFIAVSGAVAPSTVPRIYYTSDGGLTWKSCTLTGIATGTANRVTKIGDSIVIAVSGGSGGLYRVSYTTLKSAATTTSIAATLATGVASGTNFLDIKSAGNTILACGNGGIVYISKDKGYSFSQLNHGLTAGNLFGMAMYDENTAYFAGATTAMLVYTAGVFSLVTIPVTASFVAVPPRPNEVYFNDSGTSGLIYRSRDALVSTEIMPYALPGVNAIVGDIQFIGDRGELMMFLVWNSGGAAFSSLYVDRSGGAGGAAVQLLRTVAFNGSYFTMSSPNYGLMTVWAGGGNPSYFERISG